MIICVTQSGWFFFWLKKKKINCESQLSSIL